ncbi:MAG TPA: DoxX family protein [Gemmatimonadaceae bacterium]|nr:DoxX family protein [Gemmatimonadaceae bacterium]
MQLLRPERSTDTATAWAIRVSVAVVFFLVGIDKFLPGSSLYWIHVFDTIGLGQSFRYFTGIVEIVGGLLFLVPVATPFGAAMLVATMLGAMIVQAAIFKHPLDSIFPGMYLVGVVIAFSKVRRDGAPSAKNGSVRE